MMNAPVNMASRDLEGQARSSMKLARSNLSPATTGVPQGSWGPSSSSATCFVNQLPVFGGRHQAVPLE